MISLEQSIPDRFRSQVAQYPYRLALEDAHRTLTYAQLACGVDVVASALRRRGVGREQRVVLLLDQGVAAVTATLGVLSAAAAYVPLDPALPAAQLRELVEDADPALILADPRYRELANAALGDAGKVLNVEELERDESDSGVQEGPIAPGSLAYIYYTSGSTGKPKGVCDSHRNVLHNIWRYTTRLCIGVDDRLTLLQAPHFSGAVSSMWCALLNGAACFPFDVRREGLEPIAQWMRSRRITMFHSVPAIFREVITAGDFPALRCVRLEGDRASSRDIELYRRHCPPGSMLANGLGATECGLVRQWRIDSHTTVPQGPVPIGEPIDDMEIRLLDDQGHDVSEGDIGEIAVRSRYLALGYWRRPELTAARFLSEGTDPTLRTYLSGDLGRMLPGAVLQYLGRKDHQSKIRGQWVDVAAVERALLACEGVREAVVSIRQEADREPRLVAYVVPQAAAGLRIEPIRSHLLAQLPISMLPSSWVVLQALPLNANLKVDRSALPAPPAHDTALAAGFVAPRTPLERQIERIWCEVLGVDEIGVHDDLFGLGADSLTIGKVRNRLVGAASINCSIASFFEHPTIAGLAKDIEARNGS
jgi:amino acid adenylation domain-containing protein